MKSFNRPPSLQPSLKIRLSKKAMVDKAPFGKLRERSQRGFV